MNTKLTEPKVTAQIITKIREVVCDLSGMEDGEVTDSGTFLELGFDSLFMTQLANAFQKEFSLKITFKQLLNELDNIEKLAAFLEINLPADLFLADEVASLEPLPVPLQLNVQQPQQEMHGSISRVLGKLDESKRGATYEVMAAQLQLMMMQLDMIQGGPQQTTATPSASPSATAPKAEDSQVAEVKAKVSQAEPTEEQQQIKLPPGFGPQLDDDSQKNILSASQQTALDSLIKDYTRRTAKSKEQTQRYRDVHADPRTAAGFNMMWKEMVYPIVVERSEGSKLWDIDGNEYIDLLNGFGPIFLGHSPEFVRKALHEQLDKGMEIGPQTPLAGKVAELICELTGSERVTFVNTGSEAVQAAMRVARTVTGKDKVVVFSKDYHGNFDEVLVRSVNRKGTLRTLPLAPGIPTNSVSNVLVLEYGADESLQLIQKHADEIAAVLVEPMQSRRPEFHPREFIKSLRQLTTEQSIVLVFDEVITGFRTGLGGAQTYYDIRADLATYGKVLGGGMPIGVVAGKAELMNTFDGGSWQYGDDSIPGAGVTFFAGTFVRHPLAMAAAYASLSFLKEHGESLYPGVYKLTSRLANKLNRLFENNKVDIHVAHFSSQMYFRIGAASPYTDLLFYHVRMRGIYIQEGFPSYLTLAHDEQEIDSVITAFTEAVQALQQGAILEIPPARDSARFPLSAAQMDVWIASKLSDTASCAYNESDTLQLQGKLDIDALMSSIEQVQNRHSALKLRFDKTGQFQWFDFDSSPSIEFVDLSKFSEARGLDELENFFEKQATTVFNLEKGPLIRTSIVRLDEENHLVVFYAHHLVFDGWSSGVMIGEIAQVYDSLTNGVDLCLPPVLGFNTFVDEFQAFKTQEHYREDQAYWLGQFREGVPVIYLPADNPRPAEKTFVGSTLHYEFDESVLAQVKTAAKRESVTLHSFLFTAFSILLHKLSTASDFVIGVPTAGQMLASNDCLVGYGVNLLPVRQKIVNDRSVSACLGESRDKVMDAFDHPHCSLPDLVSEIGIARDPSRSPLVDIVFNFSGYFDKLEFGGVEASVVENARRAVNFDMFLNMVEAGDSLQIDWDFSRDLFSETTLMQWVGHLACIIRQMAQDSERTIAEVALMNDSELQDFLSSLEG